MRSGNGAFGRGKGKGKGKPCSGPCFICGKPGHTYSQCPDRFAKGSKGKGKGKSKGKGKGSCLKGKTQSYYVDMYALSIYWQQEALSDHSFTRVVVDTGASENATGALSLEKLLDSGRFMYSVHKDNMPTFRFGNGERSTAASRVDVYGTTLGTVPFYVLTGNLAENTPPLLGARTLRDKQVGISYAHDMFIYNHDLETLAVKIQTLPSKHITIDLAGQATKLQPDSNVWVLRSELGRGGAIHEPFHEPFLPIFVLEKELDLGERLTQLSQRLRKYRLRDGSSVREAAAKDDPRHTSFPCYTRHLAQMRQNRFATWETCQRCGLRLSYAAKDGHKGEGRHMGPDPNLHQKDDATRAGHREGDHGTADGGARKDASRVLG